MKILCIYHSADLDGWMSAAIVKHWFVENFKAPRQVKNYGETVLTTYNDSAVANTLDLLGWNYGNHVPSYEGYDQIIMCDISFPIDDMVKLIESGKGFTWIDHHISAMSILDHHVKLGKIPQPNGLRRTDMAACELTWMYFFGDNMPEIVRLLGRYDCFGHKGTDEEEMVLWFQYGARACIYDVDTSYFYLHESIDDLTHVRIILDRGSFIYKYLITEAKQAYRNKFELMLDNPEWDTEYHHPEMKPKFRFACINKERFNPINFGIDYHADGYDGVACFWYNGKYNFSIYNDNGLVDCSLIAKSLGGGGHRGASGFILTKEQFLKLVK